MMVFGALVALPLILDAPRWLRLAAVPVLLLAAVPQVQPLLTSARASQNTHEQ